MVNKLAARRYLFCILFFVQNSGAIGSVPVSDVALGLNIAEEALYFGNFVKNKVAPNEYEKDRAHNINYKIESLKTEDLFHRCLVKHARSPRAENHLPVACQQLAKAYTSARGPHKFKAQQQQFLLATKDLVVEEEETTEKGWSKRKKVVVGGAVVAVGAGTVLAVPIVLPGAIVVMKSVALVGTIKATVAAAGTKVGNLIVANKLMSALGAILVTKKTRPLVYETPDEELASLKAAKQKRTPLGEQIMLAQTK